MMRQHHWRVDASVEASRPRDFAVRFKRSSSESAKASTASRPTFVTMANVPLSGETGEAVRVICPTSQALLRATQWHDGQITLIEGSGVKDFHRQRILEADTNARRSPECSRPRRLCRHVRSQVSTLERLSNAPQSRRASADCEDDVAAHFVRFELGSAPTQHPIRLASSPKSLATMSQLPLASRSYFCDGPYSVGRATNAVFNPNFWAAARS